MLISYFLICCGYLIIRVFFNWGSPFLIFCAFLHVGIFPVWISGPQWQTCWILAVGWGAPSWTASSMLRGGLMAPPTSHLWRDMTRSPMSGCRCRGWQWVATVWELRWWTLCKRMVDLDRCHQLVGEEEEEEGECQRGVWEQHRVGTAVTNVLVMFVPLSIFSSGVDQPSTEMQYFVYPTSLKCSAYWLDWTCTKVAFPDHVGGKKWPRNEANTKAPIRWLLVSHRPSAWIFCERIYHLFAHISVVKQMSDRCHGHSNARNTNKRLSSAQHPK